VDPLCEGDRFLEREAQNEERSLKQEIGQISDGLVCFVFRDLSPKLLDDCVLGIKFKGLF